MLSRPTGGTKSRTWTLDDIVQVLVLKASTIEMVEGQNADKLDEQDEDAVKTVSPEELEKYREKLEHETGKKYQIRTSRKDLPPIDKLLAFGPPGKDPLKPPTWKEILFGPVALLLMFVISLVIFHHTVMTRPRNRKPYSLPKGLEPILKPINAASTKEINKPVIDDEL